jgi:hypothetical protein
VDTICENAFYENSILETVVIPESDKEIGLGAFASCKNLEHIELPRSLEIIKGAERQGRLRGVFEGCKNMKNIILPDGLKEIGAYAFARSGLTSVSIPEGVIKVGEMAFCGINAVSVIIPRTVREIGKGSFYGLKEITVYNTLDPDAKECTEHYDEYNGKPNSNLGYALLYPNPNFTVCAASPNTTWSDHMITVLSSDSNEILYKVWMGGIDEPRAYYCMLASSWGRNAGFNFAKYDEMFGSIKNPSNKVKVALTRLEYPYKLADEIKETYLGYLKRSVKRVVEQFIDEGDCEGLAEFETYGFITNKSIDVMIDYANKAQNTECLSYLMDYKNSKFGVKDKKFKL